jgi:hypothetical protein
MAKLKLDSKEIALFQKIAHHSHMDNWFNLSDDGVLRDRENNNRIMSVRNGCKQLMEGLEFPTIEVLTYTEVMTLLQFVGNKLKGF